MKSTFELTIYMSWN